jgi:hypothetical protein
VAAAVAIVAAVVLVAIALVSVVALVAAVSLSAPPPHARLTPRNLFSKSLDIF